MNLQEDIVEGVALLNKYMPGWAHLINVDELDMSNFNEGKDLLSQLYGDYNTGYEALNIEDEATGFGGFYIIHEEVGGPTWQICTREWKRIIRKIQALPEGEPFEVEAIGIFSHPRKDIHVNE